MTRSSKTDLSLVARRMSFVAAGSAVCLVAASAFPGATYNLSRYGSTISVVTWPPWFWLVLLACSAVAFVTSFVAVLVAAISMAVNRSLAAAISFGAALVAALISLAAVYLATVGVLDATVGAC